MTRFLPLFVVLSACGGTPAEHGHPHDGAHDHEHPAKEAPAPVAADAPAAAPTASPPEVAMGTHRARLEATATALTLTVIDATGAAITPAGEARVQLTGTGEEAQRVVLQPQGSGWSGEARASGAEGYVAVVSVDIDGHPESARFAWGKVPEASHGHAHDEGHDHEGDLHPHEHDDEGGHAHGEEAGHGHEH